MRLLLGCCLALIGAPLALGQKSFGPGQSPVVLCSIAPIACWTANVAGSRARVETLLPADVGPHDFQFRPRDLKRIRNADLIVINGLGIEDWLDRALRANAASLESKLVRTSDGLEAQLIHEIPELELSTKESAATAKHTEHAHEHGADGGPNPHVWLDPVLARHGVSNILAGLIRIDPAGREVYRQNATAYLSKLETLDADLRTAIARLPQRSVVTFHDAFPYFLRRYGLDLVGVIEENPGVEPSPRYISELLKVVRARGVKTLFTEPQFSPRLAKRLAEDLQVAVGELDVLETGRPTPDFYEAGLRRNLRALEQHLR